MNNTNYATRRLYERIKVLFRYEEFVAPAIEAARKAERFRRAIDRRFVLGCSHATIAGSPIKAAVHYE